ncbi:hypothetical protein Pint_11731 [Pistacia integerrima]|uniref:Uncharacterized protein n=1 Tax=Pistacia integerrima TaxID=434235 RepID=A0ACC0XIU3_9ROSI|nr:hypothetical protein Pint_11731 [Pistacia integerrima]
MCRVLCAGIEVVICMVVCMELQHDCCIFCSFWVKSSVWLSCVCYFSVAHVSFCVV